MDHRGTLALFLTALSGCVAARGQAVVSAHSGVINLTEGSVSIDNQPSASQPGKFPAVGEGSTLSTEDGRAEILLTPGVFLRVDKNSAIRVAANSLTDTRVEFLHGSIILDANDAPAKIPDQIAYKNYQVRFLKTGVYRIDADTGTFETYTGEAEIKAEGETPVNIDEEHQFFFNIGMQTRKYGDGAIDQFSEWARDRAEKIAADNHAAAQSLADPADSTNNTLGGLDPLSTYGGAYGGQAYNFPAYGGLGSNFPLSLGFGSWYSPFGGLPVFGDTYVFYVLPRWYHHNPGAGHTSPPVLSGYPVPSTTHTGIPRYYPSYPVRPISAMPPPYHIGTPRVSPGVPRIGISTPRVGAVGAPRVGTAPHMAIGAHR